MHLRYYQDENGKRVYTLKNTLENGDYTLNAHPGILKKNIFSLKKLDLVQMISIRKSDMNAKRDMDFSQPSRILLNFENNSQ